MKVFAIPIDELDFFSKLVKDYYQEKIPIEDCYTYTPTWEGLNLSFKSKKSNFKHRQSLNQIIDINYPDRKLLTIHEQVNLTALCVNAMAVTTAHQPNLFLGPLYTITKAISTIKLANKLTPRHPDTPIVPIFIVGSEDHDKEELLEVTLFGQKYRWNTNQTGPVGSMIIDQELVDMLTVFVSKFGTGDHADKLKDYYLSSYTIGSTISEAYRAMLRAIFGKYGLIVLDLNGRPAKVAMIPIFEQEITHQFAKKNLSSHVDQLRAIYRDTQASMRDINLFELRDNDRIRIESNSEELIKKLYLFPEQFSPNVILRPLMQQTVIPSIANIGGAAEVAYWLQLKPIFDAANVDFPVILLRDIIAPLDAKSWNRWTEVGLGMIDFFQSSDTLKKKIVLQDSEFESIFLQVKKDVNNLFEKITTTLHSIDSTLVATAQSEEIKMQKSFDMLQAKALKSEKKKMEDSLLRLEKIQHRVFENNVLIERKENFSAYYSQYGPPWIEQMIDIADPFSFDIKLAIIPKDNA